VTTGRQAIPAVMASVIRLDRCIRRYAAALANEAFGRWNSRKRGSADRKRQVTVAAGALPALRWIIAGASAGIPGLPAMAAGSPGMTAGTLEPPREFPVPPRGLPESQRELPLPQREVPG
jgi:hypothetical protein